MTKLTRLIQYADNWSGGVLEERHSTIQRRAGDASNTFWAGNADWVDAVNVGPQYIVTFA